MHYAFSLTLVIIPLFFSLLFGIDAITSESPSDAALIRIGISDRDSSICEICSEGGDFYNSGCKRCQQDGVVFTVHVIDPFFTLAWSNNDWMYHGDNKIDVQTSFQKVFPNVNDTFWIEIIKDNSELTSILYNDENFSDVLDSVSIHLSSNPTNLNYIRISNQDGKPEANGGKIVGYFDDIKIWNGKKYLISDDTKFFSTNFNECNDKTCNNKWVLQNPNRIFINSEKNYIEFISEVSGTTDYAHFLLPDSVSDDSWVMRFTLHIDELKPHPEGKGFLQVDPTTRQLLIGIFFIMFVIALLITVYYRRKK